MVLFGVNTVTRQQWARVRFPAEAGVVFFFKRDEVEVRGCGHYKAGVLKLSLKDTGS